MGILDDVRLKGAAYRVSEEALYAEALREMESGLRRDGIWAKALADSNMDREIAAARYIKLRVKSLKDEVVLAIVEAKNAQTFAKQTQLRIEENTRLQLLDQAERANRLITEEANRRLAEKYSRRAEAWEESWATNAWLRALKRFLEIAPIVVIVYFIIWSYKHS